MAALEITESDLLDAQAGVCPDELTVDIEKISTVNELNKAYKWLRNTKDTSWKPRLSERSKLLGAHFDEVSKIFVALPKSNGAPAML
jgi:hypothetical protein